MIATNSANIYLISDASQCVTKQTRTQVTQTEYPLIGRETKKRNWLIYCIDNLNTIFWQFNPNLIVMDTCLKAVFDAINLCTYNEL